MCVGAAAIGVLQWIVAIVIRIGRQIRRHVVVVARRSVVHMLVRQGMRVGELRRVQNRHLTAAEHRHGEQSCDHYLFDDLTHGAQQSWVLPRRQVQADGGKSWAAVI